MEVKEASARYVSASGYKQTDVGVIPEDWMVKPLGMLCEITAGRDLVREDFSPVADHYHEYPIYSNALTNKGLYGYSTSYQYKPDKITVTARGDIGHANYRSTRFCAIGRLLVLSARQQCDLRFVTEYINNFVAFALESTGVPQLTAPQISTYAIALPPTKAEQEAIAEALSDADALIESLEQLLTKKRHLKQGAMQELLTGKKRLPGFSGEWEVKSLGDLFDFSGGFSASRDQLSEDGYCYLHYGDIHTSNKIFIDVRSKYQDIPKLNIPLKKVSAASLLDDGDIVFVDASEDDEGTSKHVVIVNPGKTPFISGLHTIVAKSRTNELNHLYRRYCFQTRAVKTQFRFYAVGTKVSGVSKTNIVKITLPVPSVSEQTAIASILSDMDAEIAALEEKIAKARNIKQGMMQELLTGRIRLVKPKRTAGGTTC